MTLLLLRSAVIGLLVCSVPLSANAQSTKNEEAIGPAIDSPIADFSLNDQDGRKYSFSEKLKNGPVAIVFHRSADW